jgi:hypothetical protein
MFAYVTDHPINTIIPYPGRVFPIAMGFFHRLYGLMIFYGTLAVMGLIPVLNTSFGLIPILGHDVWLHALTALAAAYFWRVPAEVDVHHRDVTGAGHL